MAQEKTETQIVLEEGKWIWIEGSARLMVKEGRLDCFGRIVKEGEHILVGRWRSISGLALEDTSAYIFLGSGSSMQIESRELIPSDWKTCVRLVHKNKGVVAILGGVDRGKSTLVTFLINSLVKTGYSVGIVDCDVGQSSLGPPCSIGWGVAQNPIVWLEELKLRNAAFVGVTSPSRFKSNIISSAMEMVREAVSAGCDVVIMDTGGWVEGDDASAFKQDLIKHGNVQTVISLNSSKGLRWLQHYAEENALLLKQVSTPFKVRKRDVDVRRLLRARAFHRWIKDGYIQKMELGRTQVHTLWGSLDDLLDASIDIRKLLIGALVGLIGNNTFLGLGVVNAIDMHRRHIRLYTPVNCHGVNRIHVSELYLDKKGHEVGVINPWGIE